MGLSATLSIADRAPRKHVAVAATMRVNSAPVDIELSNISATGFNAHCPVRLELGELVAIGVTGMGRRDGIVKWASESQYGIEFVKPIDMQTLESIRQINNIVDLPNYSPSATDGRSVQDRPSPPILLGVVTSLGLALGYTLKAIWQGFAKTPRPK